MHGLPWDRHAYLPIQYRVPGCTPSGTVPWAPVVYDTRPLGTFSLQVGYPQMRGRRSRE